MLELKNVSKSYGSFKAIENINMKIGDGEIFGFIGKNGAGKSTTIKACVGIHDYEGEILYNGLSLKASPIACKKMLAYVPDNPDLYESLTGIKYLDFVCDIFEVKGDRQKKVHDICSVLQIEDALSSPISTYSHGMKQKIALAGAFIHEPKVLILDEPFVGLDPEALFHLKALMRGFCEGGGSIFFSSHVLEIVEKLCHRVAIIHKGKIVKMGTVEEIKADRGLEEIFMELESLHKEEA